MNTTTRRIARAWLAAGALVVLSACASFGTISADVATFGSWPANRAAGTYTFERLPSQQANAAEHTNVEEAAKVALAQAGFKPSADAKTADVIVQIGARITASDRSPFDDPLWWRWGAGHWHRSGWPGYYRARGYGPYWMEPTQFEREAAVLIRDRASGEPLYEARASNEGLTPGNGFTLDALFRAALQDFPKISPSHRVVVPASAGSAAASASAH